MNVAAHFDLQARRAPGAPALVGDDGPVSYAALHELAQRFAHLLHGRGIGAGDRVAMLLPNDAAFAVAVLGSFWAGATAAVLSPAWASADAARALALADARLVVTTSAAAAAIGIPRDSALLVDDLPGSASLAAYLARLTLPRPVAPAPAGVATPATILFSSGTTGDPKGVVLTHGNLLFNARAKIRYCGIRPTDHLAMVVPMAHCFGQNVILLGALLAGAAVRIYPRFDAGHVADGIVRGEVTMLLAAPTAFARLLEFGDDALLAPLRYALSAAAPLGADLAARWRAASGRPLAQGYGLTECSPFATYDAGEGERPCAGRAIDGVELRIASVDDDRWLGAGEAGEVVLRGPNVMAGYWRRPEATARALRGGWLRTGDVGQLDEVGVLHLVDRLDDVINVAGFKAWPSDIERVVARHPAVRECAAFGVPDAARGATVGVAVVLREGAVATAEELMRFASRQLAGFQRPAHLHLAKELPRGPGGKVLRCLLRAKGRASGVADFTE